MELKVFGEESGKVISYAATMAHASESGLSRLFDNLLASDGGFREQVEDVDFYEEGGVGGRIHGETVLFGTAGFIEKTRREPAAQLQASRPVCSSRSTARSSRCSP